MNRRRASYTLTGTSGRGEPRPHTIKVKRIERKGLQHCLPTAGRLRPYMGLFCSMKAMTGGWSLQLSTRGLPASRNEMESGGIKELTRFDGGAQMEERTAGQPPVKEKRRGSRCRVV